MSNEDKKSAATRKRAVSLISRFYREAGADGINGQWYEQAEALTGWLLDLRESKQVSVSTFNNYRRWLAAYCEETDHPLLGALIRETGRKYRIPTTRKPDTKVDLDGNVSPTLSKTTHQSDTALYAAGIEEDHIKTLGRLLMQQKPITKQYRYQYGVETLFALRCSMLTGLRPIEWKDARLHDTLYCELEDRYYDQVMSVNTAKLKSSQLQLGLFQPERHLILDSFTDEEYRTIIQFLSVLPKDESGFTSWYESVRKTLSRAMSNIRAEKPGLFQGPVSWYTGRHIFASEVRREGQDNYSLAAMLGHADTQNQRYYGDIQGDIQRLFTHSVPKAWPGEPGVVEQLDRRHQVKSDQPDSSLGLLRSRFT